jgi:sugar lactone lactonase YvrE
MQRRTLALAALLVPLVAAPNTRPTLVHPNGLAVDPQGTLYISDIGTHQILKRTAAGDLTVIAGTGESGFNGDGGPANKAQLFAPHDITFDRDGNMLIADSLNHRIRRIDRQGTITTIAGTGTSGYTGDGGPAIKAQLNAPQSVEVDPAGNIFIADTYNHVVRRIDRSGVITTFAGKEPGLSGDGGPATAAQISLPMDVAVAPDGSVYITDGGNSRLRRVTPDGTINTVAGYGQGSGLGGAGFSGDGGPADKARLFSPAGLHTDKAGNLYISDSGNNRIRVIREGTLTTVAGSGDTEVLNTPQKIAAGADGRLFVADRGNARVIALDDNGTIRTVTGGGR